jgi:hypothetical protein
VELDFELQEFQKLIIKDKINLKFEECLKEKFEEKNNFARIFRNEMDIYITNLSEKGVTFFGININFPEWLNIDIKDKAWYIIHYRVEEFLVFISKNIELSEFCYLSIEKNKQGLPVIHGLLGVRNVLAKNTGLINQLKTIFYLTYTDILIKELLDADCAKNYWNFCVKENNFKFHRMMAFSQFFSSEFDRLSEQELKLIERTSKYNDCVGYICGGYIYNSLNSDIRGINSKNKTVEAQLIYFFSLYMRLKNIFFRKSDSKSNIIDFLRKNNVKIIEELKKKFPQQLSILSTQDILLIGFESTIDIILKNKNYLPLLKKKRSIQKVKNGVRTITR